MPDKQRIDLASRKQADLMAMQLIEGYRDDTPGQDIYPAKLECAIRSAETERLYPPDFDVRDYVRCFAETLALIENAGKKPAARSILQQLSKLRTQAAGFRRHVA